MISKRVAFLGRHLEFIVSQKLTKADQKSNQNEKEIQKSYKNVEFTERRLIFCTLKIRITWSPW